MARETHPPSDSICTEDFVRCFREEMVEMALIECNMQQLDKEEEAEGTEISDSDTCQSEQKGRRVLNGERRGSPTPKKTSNDTGTAHYSPSNKPGQRKELEKCPSGNFGVNISHIKEKAPHRLGDDRSSKYKSTSLWKTKEMSYML